MRLALFVLILGVTTMPAWASDGVHEINHVCATTTGCFTGDTGGYPVTITGAVGRSYQLTSDLLLPDRNTTAIEITRRDTSVDLNGFEIILTVCQTLNCAPVSGSGDGVRAIVDGVSVSNGSIVGTGDDGVDLGNHATVSNLRVRWNGGDGIFIGAGSMVTENVVYENGATGIRTLGGGVTISKNVSYENAALGILAAGTSMIMHNLTYRNDATGIQTATGSAVLDNTSQGNGANSGATDAHGIRCALGCSVRGNSVAANRGFGLSLDSNSAYRENVVTSNFTGTVDSGINLGDNYCTGTGASSASCP